MNGHFQSCVFLLTYNRQYNGVVLWFRYALIETGSDLHIAPIKTVSHLEMVSSWNMDFPMNLGKSSILTAQAIKDLQSKILSQNNPSPFRIRQLHFPTVLLLSSRSNFAFSHYYFNIHPFQQLNIMHLDAQGLILKCTEVTCPSSITLNPAILAVLSKITLFSQSQVPNDSGWFKRLQN
jgi:hypothetical protein